jgi:hypothetical protein
MSEQPTRPRWGWLYPIPALGAASFWVIQRLHPSVLARDALGIGVLLLLGGYVEIWGRTNRYALMHEPRPEGAPAPLYYEREATPVRLVRGSVIRTIDFAAAARAKAPRLAHADVIGPAAVPAPAGAVPELMGKP